MLTIYPTPGDRLLSGRGAGVDAVLVDDLAVADELLRPDGPPQLPPGHGERLPRRPDRDSAIPHSRQRRHSDHLASLKHLGTVEYSYQHSANQQILA